MIHSYSTYIHDTFIRFPPKQYFIERPMTSESRRFACPNVTSFQIVGILIAHSRSTIVKKNQNVGRQTSCTPGQHPCHCDLFAFRQCIFSQRKVENPTIVECGQIAKKAYA